MKYKELFVVGAGLMGAGIAQNAAMFGLDVVLYDINEQVVKVSRGKINALIEKLVLKGKMTQQEGIDAISRIRITTDIKEAKNSDFVIEAAPERLELKKSIFMELDRVCKPSAILATNTSSLPITALAGVTKRPDKVIGTHFFSPVPLMKLCEIVVGYTTSEETYQNTVEFATLIGKETIRAFDKGGFVVDRMLNLFLNEAVCLLEEGVGTVEDIDNGCKFGLNHPMGPLELIDLVGADITLAVVETLFDEYKDPKYRPSTLLKTMVRAGHLGRKTGIGFYDYSDGTQKKIVKL